MKRPFVKIFSLVAALTVLWPDQEKLTETYQENLFTALPAGEAFRFEHRSLDTTVRLGPTIDGNLMQWHRVRLGYPFAAITTDTQLDQRIFQLRWEGYPFLVNLGMGAALGFVAGCIVATMKRNREIRKRLRKDIFPDA